MRDRDGEMNFERFMEEMNIHGGRAAIASYFQKEVENRLQGFLLRDEGPRLVVGEFDPNGKREIACNPTIKIAKFEEWLNTRSLGEFLDRNVERIFDLLTHQVRYGFSNEEDDLERTAVVVLPADSEKHLRFGHVAYFIVNRQPPTTEVVGLSKAHDGGREITR